MWSGVAVIEGLRSGCDFECIERDQQRLEKDMPLPLCFVAFLCSNWKSAA